MTVMRTFPPLGAHLRRVHSGFLNLSGTHTAVVTIPQVSLSRSVLFFTCHSLGGALVEAFGMRGSISSETTLTFSSVDLGGAKVSWQVAEFQSGITVRRGLISSPGVANANVTLPSPVDLSRSFVVVSAFSEGAAHPLGAQHWLTFAHLVSTVNLALSRHAASGDWNIAWQVVSLS